MSAPSPTSDRRPPLSVCIATMNRERYIGETLESLAVQWWPEAELAILDGSGGDATERIVAGYRERLPGLRYERRPPAGFDRDYCAAVAMSAGEYCWLLADDDVLRPGALAAVRRALEDGPDAVIVNAEVRDAELREVLDPRRLEIVEDRRFGPAEFEAFARLVLAKNYVSFVGSLVIRRAVWDEREKERYAGTEFLPAGVVLQRPFAGTAVVLAEPWITIRYGVAQWLGRAFKVWNFAWPETVWSCAALSAEAREGATPREPWRQPRRLLAQRASGWLDWQSYRRWMRDRPLGAKLRCWVWLLCLVPFPALNRLLAARVRRRGDRMRELEMDGALARWRAARQFAAPPARRNSTRSTRGMRIR